jgi:PAS domain S-box-containing protein
MIYLDYKYPLFFANLYKRIEKLISSFNFKGAEVSNYNWDSNCEYDTQFQILNKSTILSVSDLKGNILFANDRFCEVSKYSLGELIGKPHSIIRHPDTPSILFKEMWQTIGKGNVWQGEIKNQAKDGTVYWVYATISPVIGKNGKPVRYISVRQDITKQKLMAEELTCVKNNDIKLYDSMFYAKYVHSTFLTPEVVMHEAFPESFLIYKAQNIVSGDFHMVQHTENKTAFILGDSTGHGVSASYISVMILNMLNRFLSNLNLNPSSVLFNIHKEICSIRNRNTTNSFMESADMAFCLLDHNTNILEYSIAKLRGVVVRDGEIIELKRDKFSVGESMYNEIVLNKHVMKMNKGDVIFLYTDGVIDQFGGSNCKKFGNKRLIELFKECSGLPMKLQEKIINSSLLKWQGNNEQIDDISLVGFKII